MVFRRVGGTAAWPWERARLARRKEVGRAWAFGDRIVQVNGENVTGKDSSYVRDKVRGKKGTVARVTVERNDSGRMETVDIRRNRITGIVLLILGLAIFLLFGMGLEPGLTTNFGMNPGLGSQAARIPDLTLPASATIYLLTAVAVFLGSRFLCLDALWPPERFAELYPKLVSGYAFEALSAGSVDRGGPPDPEAEMLQLFADLVGAQPDEQRGVDLGRDIRVETKTALGAGLVWEGSLVQLSVFPR